MQDAPAVLIVWTTPPAQTSRVSGGTEDLGFTVGGLVDGDAAADVVSGDSLARTTGDNAGTYTLSLGSLAIKAPFTGKYKLPAAPSATTYTITKKPVTYTSTAADKVYDGTTAAPSDLGGSFSPALVGDDVVTVTGGAYASADVADDAAVTGATAGGAAIDNYTVTVGSVTGDITKRPVTVAAAVVTRPYDGTTTFGAASLSGGAVTGEASGESLTLTVTGGTFASDDAATGITVSSPQFSFTEGPDTDSGNYQLPTSITVTGTITKRQITAVGAVTVTSRDWDGTTTATFDTSAATGTGVLTAELAAFRSGGLAVSGSFPAAAETTAGDHSIAVTYSLADAGTGAGEFKAANYEIATAAATATLTGTLTAVAPGAPQSAAAVAVTDTVEVSWAAPASGGGAAVSSYRVRWRTAQVGEVGDQDYAAAGAWQDDDGNSNTGEDVGAVTSYTISDLVAGTVYEVAVAATNSAGTGEFTDPVQAAEAGEPDVAVYLKKDPADTSTEVTSLTKAGQYTFTVQGTGWVDSVLGTLGLFVAACLVPSTGDPEDLSFFVDCDSNGLHTAIGVSESTEGSQDLTNDLYGATVLPGGGTLFTEFTISGGAFSVDLTVDVPSNGVVLGAGTGTFADPVVITETAVHMVDVAPIADVAAVAATGSVELTWSNADFCNATAPACTYWVRYKKTAGDGSSWSAWTDTGWSSGTTGTYTVTGLDAGTGYDFEIERREGTGQSQVVVNEGSVSATTQSPTLSVCAGPSAADGCTALTSVSPGAATLTVKGANWPAGDIFVFACLAPSSGNVENIDHTRDCDYGTLKQEDQTTAPGSQDLGDPYTTNFLAGFILGNRLFTVTSGAFSVDMEVVVPAAGMAISAQVGETTVYYLMGGTPALAGLAAGTSTANQVALSWTAAACSQESPACTHQVRHRKAGGDWPETWTDASSATGHTVTGLESGARYEFGVRRCKAASSPCEPLALGTVSATTLDVPSPPTGLAATPNQQKTQYDLSWTAPAAGTGRAAVTGYDIEHSADGTTGWTRLPNATTPADP
ncbi:MAG: fibronectin type III domain-containing protein, partial [Acidimicrobiaceae bacterium]|nr:fibronectin type III domain-containing protein [Acidimicrobiaceae bacterium]